MFVCIPPGKAIPEMTYTVSGGTLNPTHSLTHSLPSPHHCLFFIISILLQRWRWQYKQKHVFNNKMVLACNCTIHNATHANLHIWLVQYVNNDYPTIDIVGQLLPPILDCWKIFLQKYKIWAWKSPFWPYLGNLKSKNNLICLKFSAAQKLQHPLPFTTLPKPTI